MKTSSQALFVAICLALTLAAQPGAINAQQSFQIMSLSTTSSSLVEHNTITGDDRGGIAISSTRLMYTGDNATGAFPTSNLSSGSATSYQYDAIASNIRTKQVYALGTTFGLVQMGGDTVTRLVPLDPTTGAAVSGDILLSTPISITNGSTQAGIFSGWDRIVLLDGSTLIAYNIDLPSGLVTSLGPVSLYVDTSVNDRCGCENWATWGIAEYYGGSVKLVYVASPSGGLSPSINGFLSGSIKRYDVSNGNVSSVADFPMGLADMCVMTVDPSSNRWYFHYEGYSGSFGFGSDENIGYAAASFLAPSSAVAKITGRVTFGKGRGLSGVVVRAVGSNGKTTTAITNTYGQYMLPKLPVGQTYIVSVEARRYYFPVSSELVVLNEDLIGLDFEAF